MPDSSANPFAHQALRRPAVTLEQARELLASRYGLNASRLKALDSFRDQNFRVDVVDGSAYVLKIANSMEPVASLELENGALTRLARLAPELPVPRLIAARDGSELVRVQGDGESHWARVLTFAPGRILADRPLYSPPLIESFARSAATLVRGLAGYEHPAADRRLQWDLRVAAEVVAAFVEHVKDPERRALVDEMVARYERDALPLLSRLRLGIIHGDLVGWNVIVAASPKAGPSATGAQLTVTGGAVEHDPDQIVGLIDFGDTALSYVVGELAVVLADIAMHTDRPLPALGQAVRAFHGVYALEEAEVDALFALVGMRVCVTAVSAAQQAALDPDNPYVSELNDVDWPTLRKLAAIDPGLGRAALRQSAGFPPLAHSHQLTNWLARFEPDGEVLAGIDGPFQALDLSIGSDLFIDGNWDTEAAVQASLESELEHLRAERLVGVGRWAEPRLIYALWPAIESPHTVHVGLDIFRAPGTVVRSPMSGHVRAAEDDVVVLEHQTSVGPFYTRWSGLRQALTPGDAVASGDRLGEVAEVDDDVALPAHLHVQAGLLLTHNDLPALVRGDELELWLALCPNPATLLGFKPAACAYKAPSERLVLRRERVMARSQETYYREPPTMVRGWRQYLLDEHGRSYLDAINNVAHVGHCHPVVSRAADRQTRRLYTNNRFLYDVMVEYAERLTALLPDPLRVVYFCNSGSEANDLALRLARAHTGRGDILSVAGAYHGNTTLTSDVGTSLLDNPSGGAPPAHIHPIPQPNLYRGRYGADDPEAGRRYAAEAGSVIASAADAGRPIGAFIAEGLLGSPGAVLPPDGWLAHVYDLAHAAGAVSIADEVQVGFGRMGSHFWAFEMAGARPDIVTLGKMIGNGYPLSAVVTTPEVSDSFRRRATYFSTYGGNPVACAVGLAVLDVIRDEGLQASAASVGAHFKRGLEAVAAETDWIGAVHGRGLYMGVELVRDRAAKTPAAAEALWVAERMRERGIIVYPTGDYYNILKIKPPMVFSRANADFFCEQLLTVLESL